MSPGSSSKGLMIQMFNGINAWGDSLLGQILDSDGFANAENALGSSFTLSDLIDRVCGKDVECS